jgi:C-terminal processing protease CtpA/Prc
VLDGDGHPVVGAVAKVDAGQGVYAASSGAGGAFRVEAPVGHHRLFATRLVGRDEVLGPPMYLDLREEGAAGLDLTLPPDDTVGIGLVLDLQGDAIVVTWAQEGRAAAAAGVRGGDRLVAIDGEPLDRAGLVDVERTLQGAVGSTVMLTLQRGDDSLLALLVHRRPVSEDDVPEE